MHGVLPFLAVDLVDGYLVTWCSVLWHWKIKKNFNFKIKPTSGHFLNVTKLQKWTVAAHLFYWKPYSSCKVKIFSIVSFYCLGFCQHFNSRVTWELENYYIFFCKTQSLFLAQFYITIILLFCKKKISRYQSIQNLLCVWELHE